MFDKWLSWRSDHSRERDQRLSALLREWNGIVPRSDFEEAVRRRIRAEVAAEPQTHSLAEILRAWLAPQPAWASALAAVAAIMVGVAAGVNTPGDNGRRQAAHPFLHAQTLAGSYLGMVSGDTQ